MILCRGGKACAGGISDLEHAREAYRIIAQLTYEYGKEHPKDDVWMGKLHALYQMRRAMQDRELQLKKQKEAAEQKKKSENRGYDVSTKSSKLPTHHGLPKKTNSQGGPEAANGKFGKGMAWWNASFTSTFYNGLEFPNPFLDEEFDDVNPPRVPSPPSAQHPAFRSPSTTIQSTTTPPSLSYDSSPFSSNSSFDSTPLRQVEKRSVFESKIPKFVGTLRRDSMSPLESHPTFMTALPSRIPIRVGSLLPKGTAKTMSSKTTPNRTTTTTPGSTDFGLFKEEILTLDSMIEWLEMQQLKSAKGSSAAWV